MKNKIIARQNNDLRVVSREAKEENQSLHSLLAWLPKVVVFMTLITWLMTCYYFIPKLMNTALAGSTIITCLLCFHKAEQQGDL